MRICVIEPIGISADAMRAALPDHDVVDFDSRGWSDDQLVKACEGAEIITVTYRPLSARVIEALPKLRMIAVAFAGLDHVDAEAVAARGILVRGAPGYANVAVSELVIGLMICLARRIPQHNAAIRAGGIGSTGSQVSGKTIGVVGAGAIGRAVAERAAALGMAPLLYDRDRKVTLREVFERSDFVTVHVPLVPSTRSMISTDLLRAMKPSAYLINCARGPIVDSGALVSALSDGVLAGAALDVFDVEPPLPADYPLLRFDNVIATPHIGFNTAEALELKGMDALADIQQFLADES